jgi:hypothetical protein
MRISNVTISLPAEGGKSEFMLFDYYDCGDYQGYFDFDDYTVDIRYTQLKRYKISITAKDGWLKENTHIKNEIIIRADKLFTINLILIEKIKVNGNTLKNINTNDFIFDIEWQEKPSVVEIDCIDVYTDKCGYYHYNSNVDTDIIGYNGNEEIGRLSIKRN